MSNFIAKCTPSLGNVSIFWTRMTESVVFPMGVGKMLLYLRDKNGGEIAETRNGIVAEALEYDRTCNPITHLFWIDDDVMVQMGALKELLALKADIAAGVYFLKEDGLPQPLLWLGEFSEGPMLPFEPNKVLPIKFAGMGLTLVSLDVYKRMAAELDIGEDKYHRPQWYKTGDADVDENGVVSVGHTEDWWFFDNAGKLNLRTMGATTKQAFGFHVMPTFTCTCGFNTCERVLANRHSVKKGSHRISEDITGYPQKQWKQWVKGKPITWNTPDGDVVWE
jgi:hypothetical protein